MTLQRLNDVMAIAETGSFNRAAERLYVTELKRYLETEAKPDADSNQ